MPKTPSLLSWPSLVGSVDAQGRICVGSFDRATRSKRSKTVFRFYDPKSRSEEEVQAHEVLWPEYHGQTLSVLLQGIHDILVKKGEVAFDRGFLNLRVLETRAFLMETYRGQVYPRYRWWLPHGLHLIQAANLIIYMETLSPTILVGEADRRPVSNDVPIPRELYNHAENPLRYSDGTGLGYVKNILEARSSA